MILLESGTGPPPFRTVRPLVLASSSPRRRELLTLMGLTFDVIVSGIEESTGRVSGPPVELAARCAREKADAVAGLYPDSWVLGADTVVALGATVFGKPADSAEALRMLAQLSGATHEVISAFCLVNRNRRITETRSVTTTVRFKRLSPAEIRSYVNTGEPLDKAGAYGIQGMGAFLAASIEGSYTNVVGLPLSEVLDLLVECGVAAPVAEERS
ncbi:MAG TPA: Maf family protein [Syntrophobacter fumaroxidans]|nr:Maf family protein [Syntrophobacter fumaroxidans]